MNVKRFLVSWLISCAVMFGLFYVWHGLILNDFVNLAVSVSAYLPMVLLAYALISLVLTGLYQYTYIHNLKYKGVVLGALLGFFIYLIAYVFGVSFNQDAWHYIVVDFAWQIIEQGIGGAVVGFLYSLVSEMKRFSEFNQ